MIETVLYARKQGAPEYTEVIITTNPDRIEEATQWARSQGYGHFRTARIDLSMAPDFAAAVTRQNHV